MASMNVITVRYFASLRERLGRSEDQIEAAGLHIVSDVWGRVSAEPLPVNTLVAVNQEYASPGSPVHAGDEVAFFPPVTGG
jgi:molybdopterin synthase sulfur carrier subunit